MMGLTTPKDIINYICDKSNFLDELDRKISSSLINLDREIKNPVTILTKREYNRNKKFLIQLSNFVKKIKSSNIISYYKMISLPSNVQHTNMEKYKKNCKELRKDLKKLLRNPVRHDTINWHINVNYGDLKILYNVNFIPLFSAFKNAIDETLKHSKENEKKSSNKENIEENYFENVSNVKIVELSRNSKINSNELSDLTIFMINLSDEIVKSLFSPFDSKEQVDFDQDKLVEYEKKYNQFSKKFERLNYAEKNEQIKVLKSNVSEQVLTSIFNVSNLTTNNLFIGSLSTKNLLKLINSKVNGKILGKGYYYYGKTKDVIIDKPYDREIEICCVTHYMGLEEIRQAYIGLKKEIADLEFNKSYFEGLQKNFALAIYRKLINMGYIRDNKNLKGAILFEICTKILKDSECRFIQSSNNKEIDIIEIINSKKYDIVKEAFEKESSFGRLKKDLQTKKKEKENAKKL